MVFFRHVYPWDWKGRKGCSAQPRCVQLLVGQFGTAYVQSLWVVWTCTIAAHRRAVVESGTEQPFRHSTQEVQEASSSSNSILKQRSLVSLAILPAWVVLMSGSCAECKLMPKMDITISRAMWLPLDFKLATE